MHTYTHRTHPRSKTIKIRVEPPGKVIVTTPKHTSINKINDFVDQNETWIERQLAEIKRKRTYGLTDTNVRIFGQQHQRSQLDISPFNKLDSFLRATAEKYIRARTAQLAEAMSVSYQKLTIRKQKTRWGSCSIHGNLSFNWQLVHFPTEIIDYVIIHELAHRQHHNHSPQFWKLVAKYDPAYMNHRGWLKRNGIALG